jgi:phosphate transport system permease protein
MDVPARPGEAEGMRSESVVSSIFDNPVVRDRIWRALLWTLTAIASAALLWPIGMVIVEGIGAISPSFLTSNPENAGRAGGIASILVSTFMIVGVSLGASLPPAFAIAVMLTEGCDPHGRIAAVMRSSLDILAGIPSVVFGLFGLSLFCRQLGLGYSILAGGLTLGCMILPTLARALTTALEASGAGHRGAGAALGLTRRAVLLRVILPVALPGICAGIILALTRALAETAVLLFTSGYSDRMPSSVMDSGRSISVHIYELSTNVPGGIGNAYGSAFALLLVLAVLSVSVHASLAWMQRRMTGTRGTH